jgi:hypothetical protein
MEQREVLLMLLRRSRDTLTAQQKKTIRGQIFAGDLDGAQRGLDRILKRNATKEETK